MAKERGQVCIYYISEGNCEKHEEGTFYSKCQRCRHYVPKPHAVDAKPNLRKEKLQKAEMKDNIDF